MDARMDGDGGVTLCRSRGRAAAHGRGDPCAGVPEDIRRPAGRHVGRRRRRTKARRAGHDGVSDGDELHVLSAEDGRVPGRAEPAGSDTGAGRVRHRRPDAARGRPHARH